MANIQIGNLANIIGGIAETTKLEGVIIGSCLVGLQTEEFKKAMTGSSIVWMMGYKGSVDWLTSTLIDLAVIESMLGINKRHLCNRDKIFTKFTDAIKRFNPYYLIAEDNKEIPMPLRETIALVIQPHGKGKQPLDMSDAIMKYNWDIPGP